MGGLSGQEDVMDLSSFYAFLSASCFTLVGLWWNVLERRPQLLSTPEVRKLAGGIYLSFLLPALMGLFAQVAPDRPFMWRTTFGLVSVVGIVSTWRLIQFDGRVPHPGPFRRHRWVVVVLYTAILVLGLVPSLAGSIGLTPIQLAAIALICLVVIAHGLTWEFLTQDESASATALPPRSD